MITNKNFLKMTALYLMVLIMYACNSSNNDVFAEEEGLVSSDTISIQEALTILASENDHTRTLYTKNVVGFGQKAGLKFHEDWQKEDVEAGPLPALFLRGTSREIQKTGVPLGLYLGSDYPIVKANKFVGIQDEKFQKIRQTKEPEFFYDEENKLYTAMFPDFAAAAPCISCHNGHTNTPKTDWALGDIMGATTWTYPKATISTKELLTLIKTYRESAAKTYETFLAEVQAFKTTAKPEITNKWSDEGYYIPDVKTFMNAVSKESSPLLMENLLAKI